MGGRGRALCVLVEKVDSARGEGGPLENMAWPGGDVAESTVAVEAMEATEAMDATGLRATAVVRLRLRMADAAEAGSLGTRDVGTGGGEGGGECWYVVLLLYVVHEKRLADALPLPPVDAGVISVD